MRCRSAWALAESGRYGRPCRIIALGRGGSRTQAYRAMPIVGWSTIEEAAGRREAEREYLGRADWKRLLKQMTLLVRRGHYAAVPISRRPLRPEGSPRIR